MTDYETAPRGIKQAFWDKLPMRTKMLLRGGMAGVEVLDQWAKELKLDWEAEI